MLSGGVLSSVLLFLLLRAYFNMRQLARTDPLTGLFNRRVFIEQLEQEIAKVARLNDYSAVLLMLDLDFFKRINDTYGHATGDAVLKAFAKIANHNSRSIDMPARIGGEEFAISLSGANKSEALAMAERLRKQVAEIVITHEAGPVRVTVSIGAAMLSADDIDTGGDKDTFQVHLLKTYLAFKAGICTFINCFIYINGEAVLHRADTALYEAKDQGRNQTCWFGS